MTKIGDMRIVVQRLVRTGCHVCGKPAVIRFTYAQRPGHAVTKDIFSCADCNRYKLASHVLDFPSYAWVARYNHSDAAVPAAHATFDSMFECWVEVGTLDVEGFR